mmetsp:Transcript_8538/g.18195  ORF Transcript_8538/g.18195 Transcript_8538/m.18195 type:complete len:821 (-) Transcript_8538:172-2634(-)
MGCKQSKAAGAAPQAQPNHPGVAISGKASNGAPAGPGSENAATRSTSTAVSASAATTKITNAHVGKGATSSKTPPLAKRNSSLTSKKSQRSDASTPQPPPQQPKRPSTPQLPHEASLYHYLLGGLTVDDTPTEQVARARTAPFWNEARRLCQSDPSLAAYVDSHTRGTPLHVACSLGSSQIDDVSVADAAVACVHAILEACPEAASKRDGHNHVPLEGIFAGIFTAAKRRRARETKRTADDEDVTEDDDDVDISAPFRFRNPTAHLLLTRDPDSLLLRGKSLYKLVESLPDDTHPPLGPTALFLQILVDLGGATAAGAAAKGAATPSLSGINFDDFAASPEEDDVLALLYRRFVRQFDRSERFFAGDNSREEVVRHRERWKHAAVNTFHVIEWLLRRPRGTSGNIGNDGSKSGDGDNDDNDLLVHNAVRVGACPPDLLRYIVETNLESVAEKDSKGNLPLHYAAGASDADALIVNSGNAPPESYSKFLIDELLYAYPDGAGVPNADGVLPIVLAIESGKKWIGGGVRSLYEAYPAGLEDARLSDDHPIVSAMSFQSDGGDSVVTEMLGGQDDEEGTVHTAMDGGGGRRRKRTHRKKINKDESHDAIMFVQKPDSSVRDVVSTMWANEEDAGVQMLGCASLGRMATEAGSSDKDIASVALLGVTAVVNAMKNHPNEPAVQERACAALAVLAPADGVREVSFAASGAISSVVSAMQAHVSDATVQIEACRALRGIAAKGGAERATMVASVSGFTALINAMGAHPDDGDVQRETCLAMEVLTSFPDAYLPNIAGQAEPFLQAAAENFPDDCLKPAMAVREKLL